MRPTKTVTLDSEVFRFNDVETGSYTLRAASTGASPCLVEFERTAVTVAEDQTAKVFIDGTAQC